MTGAPVDSGSPRGEGESPADLFGLAGSTRFEPLAPLGRGHMGVVYRVRDRETGTEVALKTFRTRSADQLYRLKQEFRALADIVHPGLVELYELFAVDDTCFFTMEYVEGVDFLHYVRGDDGAVDVGRFVDAAGQLADGLAAVHAAGKLHRDVKPSNVLVTGEGRAVLLDFGLATALGIEGPGHYAPGAAGTLAYMAPEVVWGRAPTPAADWYSVGVMLYEALIGQVPFSGPALFETHETRPPSVRTRHPELSESLGTLIAELLDPDPDRRPQGREIVQRLAGGAARREYEITARRAGAFVGRGAELTRLRRALAHVAGGRTAIVHVVGPSGIGKSELLKHFLAATEDRMLVLRGRCHPQEEVPYKAFDTLIDALSRVLLSEPEAAATELVPATGAALVRLFPVLGRVPAFARLEPISAAAEPHEIRRQSFGVLRELLTRLSRRQRLVLWIDDLQWGDADSAALLREVLRPPQSPAMLVLLSYRSEVDGVSTFKDLVKETGAVEQETIELGPLALAETTELARRLCALQAESDQRVAEIVAEARGNPFFLGELSRSLASGTAPGSVRLGAVILDRVQQLSDRARQLLEVISVAGSPLRRTVVLQAVGLGEQGRPLLSNLEKRSLLRTTVIDRSPAVEIYHDRIREALLGTLSADIVRLRHGNLADVYERQPEADAEALFRHCLGAGRRERAGHWAVQAAERASDTLAFDRAAELYREALELRDDRNERPALLTRFADALANAGRSLDAADTFEQAARACSAAAGPEQVLELRRRAAEHYLRCGRVDAGTAAMRAVLAAVDVPYPDTPGKALAMALLLRLKLAWRGLGFRPRPREEAAAEIRRRLDSCWGAFSVLAMIDQAAAEVLAVRHLLDALDAGDVIHIAHGLGLEVTKSRQIGGGFLRRRADRLRQIMERLTEEHGGPYERAHFQVVSGTDAFEAGRWREAHDHCDRGSKILREQCRAVAWEIVTSEGFALSALAQMGELAEMARRLPLVAGNAEERGDLYAQLCFNAGFPNLVWLARDQPERARRLADDSMRRWPSTAAFDIEQYLHLIATLHIDLYVGDAAGAWRRINEVWPKLQRALLLVMESPRVELRHMRARAALAAAESPASGARETRRLLRLAAQDARRIAADANIASALPFSRLLRAGVAHAAGHAEAAAGLYAEAARACDGAAMALYAAAARYREGELRAGDAGETLRRDGEAWMRRQGVQNPAAMVRVWCPVGATPRQRARVN